MPSISRPAALAEAPTGQSLRSTAISVHGLVKQFAVDRHHVTVLQALRHAIRGRHRKFTALEIPQLEIPAGAQVALVGNNGAGKSTLLRLMSGLLRPDSGHTSVTGSLTFLSGLGIGMLEDLNVIDNARLYGAIYGVDRARMRANQSEMLDWAELDGFAGAKLRHLSAGMRARLAFAILRHLDRDVYLLDEVLVSGDKIFRQKVLETFQEWRSAGKTVVLATHDRDFAEAFSRTTIWLENGRLKAEGPTDQILDDYFGAC